MDTSAGTMLAETTGIVCIWLAAGFAAFLPASAMIDSWLARRDANAPVRQATRITKDAARSNW